MISLGGQPPATATGDSLMRTLRTAGKRDGSLRIIQSMMRISAFAAIVLILLARRCCLTGERSCQPQIDLHTNLPIHKDRHVHHWQARQLAEFSLFLIASGQLFSCPISRTESTSCAAAAQLLSLEIHPSSGNNNNSYICSPKLMLLLIMLT